MTKKGSPAFFVTHSSMNVNVWKNPISSLLEGFAWLFVCLFVCVLLCIQVAPFIVLPPTQHNAGLSVSVQEDCWWTRQVAFVPLTWWPWTKPRVSLPVIVIAAFSPITPSNPPWIMWKDWSEKPPAKIFLFFRCVHLVVVLYGSRGRLCNCAWPPLAQH